MKITIESTPELARANGLPVRVWTGTTERGTPIVAMVTRIAVPADASPEDIAQVERELAEPPTRVVDPSGSHVAAPRSCTVCLARDLKRPARFVARDAAGLEWFECGDHEPHDNVAETTRVSLTPIDDWFARHELPLPDLPMPPVAGIDPDAYALEVVESPDGSERFVTNRCRFDLAVMRKGTCSPERLAPGASATLGPDDYVAQPVVGAPEPPFGHVPVIVIDPNDPAPLWEQAERPAQRVPATRLPPHVRAALSRRRGVVGRPAHAELRERVLAAARAFVEDWEAHEAVPDADEMAPERSLYDAAVALRAAEIDAKVDAEMDEPPLVDRGRPGRADEPSWLVKDFHVLYRAALDVSESIIDPDRVSPPLRNLRAQLERLRPAFALCDAERRALPLSSLDDAGPHEEPTLTGTEPPTALDTGMRVAKDDGWLGDALNQTLATTSPPYPIATFRAATEALMRHLEDIPGAALHACEASPRIAAPVLRALLSHPEVVNAKDAASAGEFLAFALRGAQLGWHVRHAHPKDVRHVANIGAPMHEPHRSAWLDGYRIGAETLVAPVHLTDAMRTFHDSHLVYRAPETLTARERAIIAAVEAERAAAAGDPEALAAHAFGGQEGGS